MAEQIRHRATLLRLLESSGPGARQAVAEAAMAALWLLAGAGHAARWREKLHQVAGGQPTKYVAFRVLRWREEQAVHQAGGRPTKIVLVYRLCCWASWPVQTGGQAGHPASCCAGAVAVRVAAVAVAVAVRVALAVWVVASALALLASQQALQVHRRACCGAVAEVLREPL